MKILIIEDDKHILSFLKRGFEECKYRIDTATNGDDGEYLSIENDYDVIIMDWMLPSKNGLEITKNLRKKGIKTPIIMLTAKSDIEDKVSGLQNGADDYLPKPFSFKELKARIEALYRRSIANGSNILKIKDIEIDLNSKILKKNGIKISLNQKEYELLLFLAKNRNGIVSNDNIKERLWSDEDYINSNVIQVTIYNLRKKVGKDFIKSFRGLGYKIET